MHAIIQQRNQVYISKIFVKTEEILEKLWKKIMMP